MKYFFCKTLLIFLIAVSVTIAYADDSATETGPSSSPVVTEKNSTGDVPKEELLKPVGKDAAENSSQKSAATDAPVTSQQSDAIPKDNQEITWGSNNMVPMEKPHRIEASYSFNNLHPHGDYGDWNAGQLAFYHKLSPDFTYFLMGSMNTRNEGNGATGTIGAYKGWTSFLYTCTSVTAGTNSSYLPQYRIDHDFNFSVWPDKNLNFLAGASYIAYYDGHNGLIFSGGPMLTIDKLILHYRLFYNISYPGSISSFSHLVSVGYGEEGWQWTYLNVSFGNQAYMPTYIFSPTEVNQNSFTVDLQHRHWLGKYYGVFGDVSFSKLEKGYEMYGIGLGIFYEF
jgi:YaiO family outer membrane protein